MIKVLYFFPKKFAIPTDGIYTRVVTLLEYFKSKGFLVDMVSFDNSDIEGCYALDNDLINSIHYVRNWEEVEIKKKSLLESVIFKIANKLLKNFRKKNPQKELPNFMTEDLRDKVLKLNEENNYEIVLLTYTYWADLAKYLKLAGFRGKIIIDPTDFLTLQQFYTNVPELTFDEIGRFFGEELQRINYCDEIMHISYDEMMLFASFLPTKKQYFIPQFFEGTERKEAFKPTYDILFVGSDNAYNIEGIEWFLNEVFPHLENGIKIGVAGKICTKIKGEFLNLTKLGFVEDIQLLFLSARCSICPLKRGTGMKIKVVESISYGIPVVSTNKGVDGFLNKKPEGGVLVVDNALDFATQITHLVNDNEFYVKQCELARNLFKNNFSKSKNFDQLDKIFIN